MFNRILGSSFECIPLQWDTDYFGVKSARVNLTGVVDEESQNQIIEFSNNFDFTTIINLNNDKENNHWLGVATNAFIADINLQFLKVIENRKVNHEEKTYVVNNLPRDERIVKISRDAFKYSRFFNDLKLPQKQAKNIYVHWTECAFNLTNKYFVICERNDQIAGFILFSINDIEESSTIELIAVDKEFQGQKVGKSLISVMESFLISDRVKKIKVGTQVENISAIQFYNAMGFSYVGCRSVYHMWNNEYV